MISPTALPELASTSAVAAAPASQTTPAVDPSLLRRTPLLQPSWLKRLRALQEHPDAPRFNHAAGDRLDQEDLTALQDFRRRLEHELTAQPAHAPSLALQARIWQLRPQVLHYQQALPVGLHLERDWTALPTCSREDIAQRAESLMPLDADLSKLIVYRTAGTTGHPLLVPHAARAAACYQPLIERALARYGIQLEAGPETVAMILLGSQAFTVTYPCNLTYFEGAGFAKLNLSPMDWKGPESTRRYLLDQAPQLLTGDPMTFAELLRRDIPLRPKALITTAVAMSDVLRTTLERCFHCPVIDWYSLTETGPLGFACPQGGGYHLLSPDVFVEALRPDGSQALEGERGEITVTGGRNPFLPLLRYRTGDWGRLETAPCPCGDPMPRILDLEGRAPVAFRGTSGQPINPVDVSRVLRAFPLIQHELHQQRDGHLKLSVRIHVGGPPLDSDALAEALCTLFGTGQPLTLTLQAGPSTPLEDKLRPYRSDLPWEE